MNINKDLARKCPHLAAYNPAEQGHLANPYPIWCESQEHAPIFFIESTGIWAVTSYDLIEQVIRDTKDIYIQVFTEFPRDTGRPQTSFALGLSTGPSFAH